MAIVNLEVLLRNLPQEMLTERAQALPPNDRDQLVWDQYFTRTNEPSINIWDVTTLDYRPTADRREWNAPGRLIPQKAPAKRHVKIVPIEARDKINEEQMQLFLERGANAQMILDIIGASVPQRISTMVDSVYRRLEYDTMTAWSQGKIVQVNPETGQTYEMSFNFASGHYTTELTAWSDAGLNAYQKLLAWLTAAEDVIGSVQGVFLRLASLNAILADAPNLENSVSMTRSSLADRITQDKGSPFEFVVQENSLDVFLDGGTAETRVKVWPAEVIAAIPAGGIVGHVGFAPVIRAGDADPQSGENPKIDQRGVAIYRQAANEGKELNFQAQLNAIPIPEESRLYVTDIGV